MNPKIEKSMNVLTSLQSLSTAPVTGATPDALMATPKMLSNISLTMVEYSSTAIILIRVQREHVLLIRVVSDVENALLIYFKTERYYRACP